MAEHDEFHRGPQRRAIPRMLMFIGTIVVRPDQARAASLAISAALSVRRRRGSGPSSTR
jgi:hypothetical protein